ncbi:unnamed protein product [Ectocarpus sp. 13 AM-2016]
MKLFFCPKPATALLVCCALVATVSAQPGTPIPTSMDTTVTDGTTAMMETPAPTSMDGMTMDTPAPTSMDGMTMDTPAPTSMDGMTNTTMDTPTPTMHGETMGPTAAADAEGDGAAAIGGGARMTAVVSCALAALAAGAAWGL